MFDPSVFMPAFRAAGMLVQATRLRYGPALDFDCGFVQPDELLFAGEVQTAQIVIEYETAKAADLTRGEPLQISGQQYSVRSVRARGDGYFSVAELERTP